MSGNPLSHIYTVEFSAGTHISEAAECLVALRDASGRTARGRFNDGRVYAEAGDTVQSILERYVQEREK